MGLYLRSRHDFTVAVDGTTATFVDSEAFYSTAGVAVLAGYPGWVAGAVEAWRDGAPQAARLLRGLETRLGRALRMRDYCWVRVRHWRPDDVWDETLAFFEAALLFLDGALDSAARYCHHALGIGGNARPGWRKADWINRVVAVAPRLRDVAADDGPLKPLADAVGVLRNLIHERPPLPELLIAGDGVTPATVGNLPGVVVLDGKDGSRLLRALDRLGGRERWHVDDTGLGVAVNMYAFVMFAVPVAIASLSQLTTAVEFEAAPPSQLRAWRAGIDHGDAISLLAGTASSNAVLDELLSPPLPAVPRV